jgi:CMP-N-acetylneuraminic acid synthetase
MKTLILIPARAGSKRVPGKNTRLLGGLPLVAWTIDLVRDLEPVVSSDDPWTLALARRYGATPLERPLDISGDAATTEQAALHALEHYPADRVLVLQPTSPFRSRALVDDVLSLDAGHVVAVRYAEEPPLPHAPFAPTGALYMLTAERLRGGQRFWSPGYLPFLDMRDPDVDIDTEAQWARAEAIANARLKPLLETV